MGVRLHPGLQAKLTRLATQPGRDGESLVVEAVERLCARASIFDPGTGSVRTLWC
jgi:hypothetical protein